MSIVDPTFLNYDTCYDSKHINRLKSVRFPNCMFIGRGKSERLDLRLFVELNLTRGFLIR